MAGDSFVNLKTIPDFDEKIKALEADGGTVEYASSKGDYSKALQLRTALDAPSVSNKNILLKNASPEERRKKYAEIYGDGTELAIEKIVDAQGKSEEGDFADRHTIDTVTALTLSNDINNYFAVLRANAVKQITDASNTRIENTASLTDKEKKAAKEQARKDAERIVKEDEDGFITEDDLKKYTEDYEAHMEGELQKAGKFDHQNFLLGNIKEISQLSKLRSSRKERLAIVESGASPVATTIPKTAQEGLGIRQKKKDKILSTYTISTSNQLSRLRRKEMGYGLLSLPTHKLSQLVPSIRLFKLYFGTGGKKTKVVNEVEIPFPTTSLIYNTNGGENWNAAPDASGANQDPTEFLKNRDGFGIRSFTWELAGGDEVAAQVDITANLSLYFQDFAQLLTPRKNKKGEVYRYIDLLLEKDPSLRQGVQYIKAVVGWTVPIIQGQGNDAWTPEELDAVRDNTLVLKLTSTDYSIAFNDTGNGTFEFSISYRASAEEISVNTFTNVLQPPLNVCKQIGDIQKIIKSQKKNNIDPLDEKTIEQRETEIRKIAKEQIPSTSTQILIGLVNNDSIYRLSVPANEILSFQGVDKTVITDVLKTAPPSQQTGKALNNLREKLDALAKTGEEVPEEKDEEVVGNEVIYYTFLGDIIQSAMEHALDSKKLSALGFENAKEAEYIRVLTTTVKFGETYVNIADIPIDLRFYASWFYTRITSQDISTKSLKSFISDLLSYMVENRIDDYFKDLTGEIRQYRTTWIYSDSDITGAVGASTLSLKKGVKYSYLVIYAEPASEATTSKVVIRKGRYNEAKIRDEKDGVYHFVLGDRGSVVKSASFEKTDLEGERPRRLVEGSTPFAILRNVFEVNLRLYGNTLFWPGNMVFINPSHAVGSGGHPWIVDSAFNIMGFGGYHMVMSVKNSISDNVFETTLATKFHHSGHPPTKPAPDKKTTGSGTATVTPAPKAATKPSTGGTATTPVKVKPKSGRRF